MSKTLVKSTHVYLSHGEDSLEHTLKPTTLSLSLGGMQDSQARRTAYEKAAEKYGKTLSTWARETLDKAAGFKKE